jgi:aspartyl-tRNA(Asn)/glutamyl-tRNA(Gln) amidotransferase subunit B
MELGALFKDIPWSSDRVTSACLASIISLVLRKQVTGRTAKTLLTLKYDGDARTVEQIVNDEDLMLHPLTPEQYKELAQQLIDEKPDMVSDIVEKGQVKKVKWFVGQMMARGSEGSVEPGTAEQVIRELLGLPSHEEQ